VFLILELCENGSLYDLLRKNKLIPVKDI